MKLVKTPNYGAPPPNYVPWAPAPDEAAAIRARGVITDAARWDNATPEARAVMNPDFNPHKRWFEQKENRAVPFNWFKV